MPGRLQYKLDDDSQWESVDLDYDSVEIYDIDPCKEYQVKIKINDDELTWTFGNYKTNRASINHKIKMQNADVYYEDNFKPKFSPVDDNNIKVSWEDFCIPTTVDIFDENNEKVCSNVESEYIIPTDPCNHYVFYFDVIKSDVLRGTYNMKGTFSFTTPPSDSQLNVYFSYTSVTGTNLQCDLSPVFSELGVCIEELDYTLTSEDGSEVAQNVVSKYTADTTIEVPIQNECETTFKLNVKYRGPGLEGSLEKSFERKVDETACITGSTTHTPTTTKVTSTTTTSTTTRRTTTRTRTTTTRRTTKTVNGSDRNGLEPHTTWRNSLTILVLYAQIFTLVN